ncbi:MAG: hypothetical protein A2945_04370 [Candidatus Liptonbacteria bacterium RIFCSPLOWO2_01_FULL_52_25]|uniref:Uncharacterized protein n=1 Tax=Candidatus Liptonbacteria bacterium RIFCSPLOWO2_01_FULL_52_25 TaxID=1798650 RepID=A0A1G2CFS0_9BACT|nr:MAG: hypothetical protein A2945_04370 [Candidatus Liptonbacteria bacterium RIFCSPLOWO2_01_FULL_52_25]
MTPLCKYKNILTVRYEQEPQLSMVSRISCVNYECRGQVFIFAMGREGNIHSFLLPAFGHVLYCTGNRFYQESGEGIGPRTHLKNIF